MRSSRSLEHVDDDERNALGLHLPRDGSPHPAVGTDDVVPFQIVDPFLQPSPPTYLSQAAFGDRRRREGQCDHHEGDTQEQQRQSDELS